MARSRGTLQLFWMTSGLVFWAAQFTIIYGVTAVACARGWWRMSALGVGLVPASIAAATLLALGATGLVLWRAYAHRETLADADLSDRFLNAMTLWVSGLSAVAIAWNGLPAMILPACAV